MIFYYDETFHDRKLTIKDGLLNAYLDSSNDGFIYALLGGDETNVQAFLDDYEILEKATKGKLDLKNELKSTTFKKKSFKYGIASLSGDSIFFYSQFFDLLIKHNVLFQVGDISKTEVLVHRFLQYVSLPPNVPAKAFIYSLTKLLVNHRLEYIFNSLLENNRNNVQDFASSVIDLLSTLLINIKGIKREEAEVATTRNIIGILQHSIINKSGNIGCDWDYNIIAAGVYNRISETRCVTTVVIDKEQSTYDAFANVNLICRQEDSKDTIGIRAVDMFVGFVGRVVRSFKEDVKEPPLKTINDIKKELYIDKRLVSSEWFDMDKETFSLYKRIGAYFSSATFWSSFSLYYSDELTLFFSLFNYINTYDNYELFNRKRDMHAEYYNTYVCMQIGDLYSNDIY